MSDNEELSTQLHSTLRASVTRALSTRRPLLTHLNADTTWLLSVPYPPASPSPKNRVYLHLLVDPWLRGSQSDVARFFSQQWHKEPSAAQTIGEVEEIITGIEDVARGGVGEGAAADGEKREHEQRDGNWIDAVVVCHEFTDHMHKETLLDINKRVPVFATLKAAASIRSWNHFDFVAEIPRFAGDWRTSSTAPLPDWLGVSRIAYAGSDMLYYHSAIMVAFGKEEAEAVIYTPHGISPSDLEPVAMADPQIKTLGLLHGLQDIKLGGHLTMTAQLNMGAHNGLKAQRLLGAKYWIATHDEIKKGGGVVSWFLDRKVITLKEAIDKEREEHAITLSSTELESLADVRFVELGNGESLVLE